MGLNQYQASSVQVSLRMLEEALLTVDRLMRDESRGVLHRTILDIPEEQRRQIMELSHEAQDIIAQLAQEFNLGRVETPVHQMVTAQLSSAWESLEDTRPATLKRYGEVDPGLERTLGPGIGRLIELVLAMGVLARQEPDERSAKS